MKVYLRNQGHRLERFMAAFQALPLSYESLGGMRTRETRLVVPAVGLQPDLTTYDFDFLFNYRVFPPRILTFAAQWLMEGRGMQVGDTIVQQAVLPPVRGGLGRVFGVRVVEIERTADRVGFTYGTLRGHPESGTSAFGFELWEGKLHAVVRTRTKPGLTLTRLGGPFTRRYQQYCADRALERMRSAFLDMAEGRKG